jgi:hypothetical protein
MLVPSTEFSWLALTVDQAQILHHIVREHRIAITDRWSPGVSEGLLAALCDIEDAGGAYIRKLPSAPRGTGRGGG